MVAMTEAITAILEAGAIRDGIAAMPSARIIPDVAGAGRAIVSAIMIDVAMVVIAITTMTEIVIATGGASERCNPGFQSVSRTP